MKMPTEQLILHWPQRGAINSLRQAGLHTSYLLSVELRASLRGEGGGITLFPSKGAVLHSMKVSENAYRTTHITLAPKGYN